MACGVDSRSPAFAEDRLRGNDCTHECACLANDTTAEKRERRFRFASKRRMGDVRLFPRLVKILLQL